MAERDRQPDESPFASAMPPEPPFPESSPESPEPHAAAPEEFEDDVAGQTLRFVLSKQNPLRLDKYLQQAIKSVSRNQIQKLIDLGGVTVNGKPPKASQKLNEGDVVEVAMPPRPAVDLRPEPIPLDILYEDEDLVVVNKPAGLIVHPARSYLSGTLLNALAWHFQHNPQPSAPTPPKPGDAAPAASPGSFESSASLGPPASSPPPSLSSIGREEARPGVVHRLDLNTTGVIIVAKRDETHWLLARQFEQRTNLKVYLALVHGCPPTPGGMTGDAIDAPIGKHPTIREAMAVRFDSAGKESLTIYRVRERYAGYSLVELELKSGRTHQIRVHLSYIGCPIVGDVLYGGEVVGDPEIAHPPRPAGSRPHIVFARDRETGQRLEAEGRARRDAGELLMFTPALHAALLQLRHPRTNETVTFTAPVHSPMREMIARLRQYSAEGAVADNGHIDLTQAVPEE